MRRHISFNYVDVKLTESELEYLLRCFILFSHNQPHNTDVAILKQKLIDSELVNVSGDCWHYTDKELPTIIDLSSDYYLCYGKRQMNGGLLDRFIAYYSLEYDTWFDQNDDVVDVIAWMELPSPPDFCV